MLVHALVERSTLVTLASAGELPKPGLGTNAFA